MFRALAFVDESAQFLHDSDYTARFREVGQPEMDRLIGVYNRMVDSLRAERRRVQEQHYFLRTRPRCLAVGDRRARSRWAASSRQSGGASGCCSDRRRICADGRSALECRCWRPDRRLERRGYAARGGRGECATRHVPRSRVRRRLLLLEELTEELRQSEKAAYEKLIRMMSHEVNNSVGASSSLLQSSLSYSAQLSDDDRADFERALQIAIDRMGQLNVFMRSFADVVRLPPPGRQPVNLVEVLRRIEGLVRADREARGIGWRWAIEEDPAVVDDGSRADRTGAPEHREERNRSDRPMARRSRRVCAATAMSAVP